MNGRISYQLLADLVLSLHVAVVLFLVLGLIFIIVGNLRGWQWVNSLWFRLAHLAMIGVVISQGWLGALCPLTILEMRLREKAHLSTYEGSFIQYWLQRILYYEGPIWVFAVIYTLFGLAVLAAWRYFPPRSRRR